MATDGYRPGSFKRDCEVCGFTYYAEDTFKRWDGLIVCEADFETRHPQDFVRGRVDHQSVPDARPPPPERFVGAAQEASIFVYPSAQFLVEQTEQIRVYASSDVVTADDL